MSLARKIARMHAPQYSDTVKQLINKAVAETIFRSRVASTFCCELNGDEVNPNQNVILVDYECDIIFGSVALSANGYFLQSSYNAFMQKASNDEVSKGSMDDWLKELSNLLTGELKREFLAYNIKLNFSKPFATTEKDLILAYTDDIGHLTYQYYDNFGKKFFVHFMAQKGKNFSMKEDDQNISNRSGDILFF